MLKYVSKFILDILPSLVATVIGAYIVNHYIVARPDAPAASVAITAAPKADAKADIKTDIKALEAPADAAAGLEIAPAKGKTPVEKAAVEKAAVEKAAAEKAAEKSADTASAPADVRRRAAVAHEKSSAKAVLIPAPAPAAAAGTAVPVENASTAEERRDANDLARAAIERLRNSSELASRAARASDPPRVAPPPTVQALPPAIMVSTPRAEPFDSATGSSKSSDAAAARIEESRRPPGDIPVSGPLDLRAEAASPVRERTTVADDMLAAAKSVFHNMLPH